MFERAGSPYTKSVTYNVRITPEWRKVQVRFVAAEAYPPGGAQMIFRLGYEPETIEIGGVAVDSYAKKVALSALPTNTGPAANPGIGFVIVGDVHAPAEADLPLVAQALRRQGL